jgi:hypothetical protein
MARAAALFVPRLPGFPRPPAAVPERSHAVPPVECGDKMHLRRAGVGKTHLDPAADQRAHQTYHAVHLVSLLGFFSVLQVSCMLIRLLSIATAY